MQVWVGGFGQSGVEMLLNFLKGDFSLGLTGMVKLRMCPSLVWQILERQPTQQLASHLDLRIPPRIVEE